MTTKGQARDPVVILWREFCRAETDMERLRIAHVIESHVPPRAEP